MCKDGKNTCWNGECSAAGSCSCKNGTSPNVQNICVRDECLPGFEKNDLNYCKFVGENRFICFIFWTHRVNSLPATYIAI